MTEENTGAAIVIGVLLELRIAARARKDFAEADRLRTQLLELGVAVQDTPAGQIFTKATEQ